ncbi:MAG: hypothetical protein JO340_04255 [Acidobacteriaceae bacterium]|nr:hypothetical protein [Acidobacteriaceae bacterium]
MSTFANRRTILAIAALFSTACAVGLASEGFGFSKATVTLRRKLPAIFKLTGTDIKLTVTTAKGVNGGLLAQQLSPDIESYLQNSDHRIAVVADKPQTLIDCTITGYIAPVIQHLTRPPVVSKGKKGTTTTTPGQPYTHVTGELIVAYQARDAKTGKALDAALLESRIERDYDQDEQKSTSTGPIHLPTVHWPPSGTNPLAKHDAEDTAPLSPEDVNQRMIHQIARELSKRIVNTDESIQVLLAKGKFEHAAKLGESKLWPRMLDELDQMGTLPNQKEEAYRLYDLGVAYEAMGYEASDPEQAVKMFGQSAINYGKAIEDAPDEKYFREPQKRIESALVTVKTIAERAKNGGQPTGEELAQTVSADPSAAGPAAPVAGAGTAENQDHKIGAASFPAGEQPGQSVVVPRPQQQPAAPVAPAHDPNLLTNADLIGLKSSGMDDDNLIATIADAKKVDFDLSPQGLQGLLAGKISNKVIAAMRQKAKPATRKPASRPAAASSGSAQKSQ